MAKLIDADVLCEVALKRKAIAKVGVCNEYVLRLSTLGEILDEMPTADVEPVRKWIPCSERLPKIDENVLTCDESGFIAISSCNGGGEFSSCADDYYIGHRDKKPKVAAWMELPEPYRADGGEPNESDQQSVG